MKPCPKNQEAIALLAMEALEVQRARELRAHLAECAACRCYLGEISSVAGTLRAGEPEPSGQPTTAFHRNVVSALAATQRDSAGEMLLAKIWFLVNRRLALPALTAAALVITALWVAAPRVDKPAPTPLAVRAVTKPELKTNLEPTFSNYEMAARQSLDKLDELLTEQANRNPASPAVYTAAWLPRSSVAE